MAWVQWSVRLALAAGTVAVATIHLDERPRPSPVAVLLDRTVVAMTGAGFRVTRHGQSWPGTRALGQPLLVARHPGCAMPVLVEVTGALNARRDDRATYFYGDAGGPPPAMPHSCAMP